MKSIGRDTPGSSALRRGRASLPGQTYVLTTVTAGRSHRFARFRSAARACRAIAEQRLWRGSRLWCWVLMPDHWHGVVTLGEEPLNALMGRFKAVTAAAVNRACGSSGSVWMPGYHDHALRRDADLLTACRYVVANPLRAKLVARVGDYAYWDAVWLEGGAPALP